jgi:hypothetical protein
MPLFAKLFAAAAAWLGSLASTVMWYIHFVAWARRVAIVTILLAWTAAVTACLNSLIGAVAAGVSGPYATRFAEGLGMFIPANAGAVMACVASVWLACFVYKQKLTALKF